MTLLGTITRPFRFSNVIRHPKHSWSPGCWNATWLVDRWRAERQIKAQNAVVIYQLTFCFRIEVIVAGAKSNTFLTCCSFSVFTRYFRSSVRYIFLMLTRSRGYLVPTSLSKTSVCFVHPLLLTYPRFPHLPAAEGGKDTKIVTALANSRRQEAEQGRTFWGKPRRRGRLRSFFLPHIYLFLPSVLPSFLKNVNVEFDSTPIWVWSRLAR